MSRFELLQNANAIKIKRQSGSSLIEIMIAMAILVTLILGLTSVLTASFRSQRTLEVKMALLQMERSIFSLFQSPATCAYNFAVTGRNPIDVNLVPISIDKIVSEGQPTDIERYVVGQLYENDRVKLNQIQLQNLSLDGSPPTRRGYLDLILTLEAIGDISGIRVFTRKIRLAVSFENDHPNSPNFISRCHTAGTTMSASEILNLFHTTSHRVFRPYGATSGPLAFTCPNGGRVLQCEMNLYSSGEKICGTYIANGITCSVGGGCQGIPGQRWGLDITCLVPEL